MDNDFAGGCDEFSVDTQQTIYVMVIFLATCLLLAIETQKKANQKSRNSFLAHQYI